MVVDAEPEVVSRPQPDPPTRRRWVSRLVLVLTAAWLVFAVLHRVLSGRAYWWGPFDLLPPFVFGGVPVLLLVITAALRRWVAAGLSVLALAAGAGLSGVNVATVFYSPPPAAADAISLVTWNTEYWDQDLEPGGPHTTADFYAFLRGLDADVYMLQEYAHVDLTRADVFSQALAIDQEAQLRAALPGYTIVIAGRDIIVTRLPVVAHHWLDTTPYMPDDIKAVPPGLSDRPLFYRTQTVRADITVGGRTVSFYNAHIYQPPQRIMRLHGDPDRSMFEIDRFNFAIRRAAYQAIRDDVAANPNPVVFGGDLNTSPAMGVLGMIPDRLVDQSRALSSLYPATWPVGRSVWRLDWLFTSPEVAVHAYDLLDPAGLSDHKVQRVTLSVRGDS